jgi:hypothetical protein
MVVDAAPNMFAAGDLCGQIDPRTPRGDSAGDATHRASTAVSRIQFTLTETANLVCTSISVVCWREREREREGGGEPKSPCNWQSVFHFSVTIFSPVRQLGTKKFFSPRPDPNLGGPEFMIFTHISHQLGRHNRATHLLTYLLTYSMERRPSWEANSKLCS